ETYKTILSTDKSSVEKIWYVNDYNLIKEHIVLELQKLINEIDPDENRIVVLKDTHSLFQLKDGYCQHCKKKFIQYFGYCYGTIKKCRYCKKLTVIKDKKFEKGLER
ncbi:MAG: hypothetical protein QME42_07250, partial [bacterium]|nr:hypothetical protein [bacterium]